MEQQLEVFIPSREVHLKIQEIARDISREYRGKRLILVCILKGAVVFLADLMRNLSIPVTIDFISVSSYGYAARSSGKVRLIKDLDLDIAGEHVLLVEDIIDTGITLKFLLQLLESRGPASLKVCTLLDKVERREVSLTPDYTGFVIPDHFVVGYGLDYGESYRYLPDICIVNPG